MVSFDRERFANLLEKAKGKRSINKYGNDSNVDPGYISRLLRQLIPSPPSAIIIKKLADIAMNEVTAEDLLHAAGYLDEKKDNQAIEEIPLVKKESTNLKVADEIFFDGYLHASEEEKERLRRYWYDEIRKRRENPPDDEEDGESTPSAWDIARRGK
jgi:hypothetical protein